MATGVRVLVTADLINHGDKIATNRILRAVGRTLPQLLLLPVRVLPFLRLRLCLPRRHLLRGLRSWWVGNPTLPLPNSWSTTNDHYDANAVHGLTFRKQIDATQWSRKKGVAGKDPLNIPAQEFLFHGVSDWRLRALSHGKFFSVVPVASVAEAVFMAQVLKLVRERKVDIDTVATHVFQSDNPAAPIPNKNTDAPTLFQPLVNMIVQMLQDNTPVAAGIDQSQKFLQILESASVAEFPIVVQAA